MSVLAHVVLGGALQNEPAATQALAYILGARPDIARAFVGMLRDAGIEFEPGRVEAELEHEESQPDLTIRDSEGRARVFVENKFWAGLTEAQPVSYLGHLPEDPPSALMFIVPEQRVPTVWRELRDRCDQAGLEWADAPGDRFVRCARVGGKTISITSWKDVLEGLLHAARSGGHEAARDDILQLQGLASRMDREAFLPLRGDEVTNQEVARRLINYSDLIEEITGKLNQIGVTDVKGLRPTHGYYTAGRYLRLHGKLVTWLGIDLRVWYKAGITPLWWWFQDDASGSLAECLKTNPVISKNVEFYNGELNIPIRLKTGVERETIIEDVVAQMKRIADHLLKTVSNN